MNAKGKAGLREMSRVEMKDISCMETRKLVRRSKKAFSLIELIVVMAVMAILVLIAAPRFFGVTDEARETQIINDVRVAEDKLLEHLITNNDSMPDGSVKADTNELTTALSENKLYSRRGVVSEFDAGGDYYVLPSNFIKRDVNSSLSGNFVANAGGDVYYIHSKAGEVNVTNAPIIKLKPSQSADEMVATITYPANSISQEYKIGEDGEWINNNSDSNVDIVIFNSETVFARAGFEGGTVKESDTGDLDKPVVTLSTTENTDLVIASVQFPKGTSVEKYRISDGEWLDVPEQGIGVVGNGLLQVRGLDSDGNITSYGILLIENVTGGKMQIAGGQSHSLVLKEDGTVWSWGNNLHGQLGNGNNTHSNIPVPVIGLSEVEEIAVGGAHSLALKEDGTVWSWGSTERDILGNIKDYNNNIPVQVTDLSGVKEITAGRWHCLALKEDGTVWSWGLNRYGQLGTDSTTDSKVPVQVTGLSEVKEIAGGSEHSLALKKDGTVWSWGFNQKGQLGDGSTTNSTTPVQVTGLSDVKEIAGGRSHSLALKEDGTVCGWGYNRYGQLGNGNNTDSNTPVQVTSLSDVKEIAAGESHSLALKEGGTVWSWGHNYQGQLGNGNNAGSDIPVQVASLSGVKEIDVGDLYSLAIKEDGTAWSWGFNASGQLGNGNDIKSNTPIPVNLK